MMCCAVLCSKRRYLSACLASSQTMWTAPMPARHPATQQTCPSSKQLPGRAAGCQDQTVSPACCGSCCGSCYARAVAHAVARAVSHAVPVLWLMLWPSAGCPGKPFFVPTCVSTGCVQQQTVALRNGKVGPIGHPVSPSCFPRGRKRGFVCTRANAVFDRQHFPCSPLRVKR